MCVHTDGQKFVPVFILDHLSWNRYTPSNVIYTPHLSRFVTVTTTLSPWLAKPHLFCLSTKLRCPHTPCSLSHLIYISTTWKDQSHVTVNPSNGKLENKDRKPHTDTQKLAETLWVKELLFLLQSQTQELFLNSYWMTLIPQGERIPIPLSTCQ